MRNRRPWQPLLLWIRFVPLAWCRTGPQGSPPYQSGENTRPLGPSSHILGELVIPAGPAGNSLELCCYPFQDSRTTAHVLLGIFFVYRCPPREPSDRQDIFFVASTSVGPILYHQVPKCNETLVKHIICAVFLSREQLWNFRSSRGHIWTESVFKKSFCVCVCDT